MCCDMDSMCVWLMLSSDTKTEVFPSIAPEKWEKRFLTVPNFATQQIPENTALNIQCVYVTYSGNLFTIK